MDPLYTHTGVGTAAWREAQLRALRNDAQPSAAADAGGGAASAPEAGGWPVLAHSSTQQQRQQHQHQTSGDHVHVRLDQDADSRAVVQTEAGQQHKTPPYHAYDVARAAPVPVPVVSPFGQYGSALPPAVPIAPPGTAPSPAPLQPHHTASRVAWLVPDGNSRFFALWTFVFTVAASFLFAFMAGQYVQYTRSAPNASTTGLMTAWGPTSMWQWLKFWEQNSAYAFDFDYLLAWGGRYAPSIADGQWARLFTSVIVHASFTHLLTNLVVFVVLAVSLEHAYGPIRITIIFVASAFAGTFLSMAFEDPCAMYVGCSGAVMGFIGLYITDVVLNWESLVMPAVRLVAMLLALAFMLVLEYVVNPLMPNVTNVSHLSHIGGLLGGLLVSFLFLPNFKDSRWKAAKRAARRVGLQPSQEQLAAAGAKPSCWRTHRWAYYLVWALCAVATLFFFVALPCIVWLQRLPNLSCPATTSG